MEIIVSLSYFEHLQRVIPVKAINPFEFGENDTVQNFQKGRSQGES